MIWFVLETATSRACTCTCVHTRWKCTSASGRDSNGEKIIKKEIRTPTAESGGARVDLHRLIFRLATEYFMQHHLCKFGSELRGQINYNRAISWLIVTKAKTQTTYVCQASLSTKTATQSTGWQDKTTVRQHWKEILGLRSGPQPSRAEEEDIMATVWYRFW